jgi:hypothetical protein
MPFYQDAWLGVLGQGFVDGGQQDVELTFHHLRIQAFFGAEVPVGHRFGDARGGGDFLDGGAVQAAESEKPPADTDQLRAALQARHAGPDNVARGTRGPAVAAVRPAGCACSLAHGTILPYRPAAPVRRPSGGAESHEHEPSWQNWFSCHRSCPARSALV